MANEIHNYSIERFVFGDDDYYDIDWFDGSVYRTAKIKGSVIKAGILSGGTAVNIYNSDGTITGDRTIDADNNFLTFDNVTNLRFNTQGAPFGVSGFEINAQPTGNLFTVKNATTGLIVLKVSQDGVFINNDYKLPTTDGTAGQVMTTDGAGQVTFEDLPAPATDTNIYNTNGALTTNRIVSGSFFDLWFLEHNGFIFQTGANGTDTQNGVWFDIEEANVLNGGSLFKIRKRGGGGVGIDRLAVLKTGETRINEEYNLPLLDGTNGQVLTTDGAGNTNFQDLQLSAYNNIGSNQWSVVAPATTLPSGQIANGFSFFTEANKVASGTTGYDEYFLSWGRKLTLTGTSGTANVNILGVDYLATFNTNLTLTASDFVTTHQATLNGLGIQVFAIAGVLRFGSLTQSNLTTITITTASGTLSGTFDTAINDHVVIPYTGRPYAGQRLEHRIRINFNIDAGNEQYYALSLRRWQDDSVIGSIIQVVRNTTLTGQQKTFLSYTAGASDPFVTGGFYFALENQSGQSVIISGSAGILIQTSYQNPTKF